MRVEQPLIRGRAGQQDIHECVHSHPERGDRSGRAAFWTQTLLALRGSDWIRGGRDPRFAPRERANTVVAINLRNPAWLHWCITGAVSAKTGNRAGRFPRRRSACRWFGGDVYGAIHLVLLAYFYYRRIDWRNTASDVV